MKIKNLACIASMLLATLTAVQAQTNTLVGWTFDNYTAGTITNSPAATSNTGTASVVGLSTGTVVGLPGSSTGTTDGTNAWEVTGGWSTNSAIGSQGAQFAVGTLGYYQVQLSFDVYAQTNAEAYLQVQYSPDGLTWFNANITSPGSSGVLATNSITTNHIVAGTYLILTNSSGVAVWNTNVTVDLSGISWADNNPNFAIRIVNAANGTNCPDTTGVNYQDSGGGDWTFDNVVIQGVPFDIAADWTFDSEGVIAPYNNPFPEISNVLSATAACFGFGTPANHLVSTTFATTGNFSTNAADITANGVPYSSTGAAGQNVWRLRGQKGNGWLSTQPIGSQGGEFDVDTTGYTNIMLSFDLYFTTQGEAKMCVEYTTNGWTTTNVANTLAYALNPTFVMTNSSASGFQSPGLTQSGSGIYSPNTVDGTMFFNNYGSIFFNNCIVDFTGFPNVAGNPHFGFRIVNAATGADCVNYLYQPYNNNSGNCRLDNVAVNGKYTGNIAPAITPAASATVDHSFTNTFANNLAWSQNIGVIYVNGVKLTNHASFTITSSNIVFTPTAQPGENTNQAPLTVAGTDYIVIFATNYTSAKVTQLVTPGAFVRLNYVQPGGPSASTGTLTVQPSFTCIDQFYNPTTNTYPNMQVVATVSNSPPTWVLGGSVTQAIYNGACTYTDLTATVSGSTAVANAAITFTVTAGPIAVTNSTSFVIGKPPVPFTPGNLVVLQADTSAKNSTMSFIEVKPSAASQTSPVNIVPISATGTNALRTDNAGSGGHLTLNDNGTEIVFPGYTDGSSVANPDEGFNLNRGVGTLDYTNGFALRAKYVSNSYGGSQARAACSPDSSHYLIDDKGGLYIADNGTYNYNLYQQNNISTRSFGGVCWVETAKVANPPTASVFIFSSGYNADGTGLDYTTPPSSQNPDSVFNIGHETPPSDSVAQDFYIVSTNGNDYSILYVLDQVSGSVGVISKWQMTGPSGTGSGSIAGDFNWINIGSWTNTDGGDTLFATTNGSGGVYLFYVNGNNKIIRLTDQTAGGTLNLISTNTIYTSTNGNIAGLTFVPQQTPNATELIPPPILTAQAATPVNNLITVTNTPDDPAWRAAITGITVNGQTLPSAAYDTTQAGKIVFNLSKSQLLQTNGTKTIVISATGYSTNSIAQTVTIGAASKLVVTTEPSSTVLAGATFSTQPVVYIEDANGNLLGTNSSIVVTAAVGTGMGSLTGTLTATAVNGVVTFNGLAAPTTAQNGLKLTFTSSGLTSAVDGTSITVNPVVTAPTVTTVAPQSITAGGALFEGSINPNGGTTTYWFEYGVDTSYGNFSATNTTSITASVAAPVVNLSQGRTYHYELVATNSAGTNLGGDISFSTLTVTPPQFGSGSGIISGGGSVPFQLNFTNTPGASFSVLATTNVALPINQWSNLGTATEVSPGQYQFSDPNATNTAQFYILESQ